MAAPAKLTITNNEKIYQYTKPKFTVTFYDENDAETDPTTVTFKLRTASGTIYEYVNGTDSEVSTPSTGVYVLQALLDESGRTYIRAESDTTFGAAVDAYFDVVDSQFYS